jgi:apolipoprotein N-acyltransferase
LDAIDREEPRMDDARAATFDVVAVPRAWRIVAAAAFAVSRGVLPLMLLSLLRSRVPIPPLVILRDFTLFALLPACAAWLITRMHAAQAVVADAALAVRRPGFAVEVPAASIAGVAPWRLPFPCPGVDVVLASGRRLSPALGMDDPARLVDALARHGVAAVDAVSTHPALVWARARADWGRWRWQHRVLRYPVFALLPTAVLFNAQQHIAYGGLLGEYYLMGLQAYLTTFAIYWSTITVYQVLYASALRGLAELACVAAAAVAPSQAARVRRGAEVADRVLYFAGIPVMLALRFAPW